MIYTASVFLCFVLAVVYDIKGYQKQKKLWYNVVLIWFIFVSGLQYCVGTDIFEYTNFFKNFNTKSFHLSDLGYYMDDQKQPGWMLLIYFCRVFTDDFIIVKIIQAFFFNVALFSFFKRETKYWFVCVLIYALISYLIINFNVLRHSFALGFALYGFSYLRQKKYIQYFVFVAIAWLFHSTAILLLIFPLFHLLKYNKWSLLVFLILFTGVVFFLYKADLVSILLTIIDNGYLGEDLSSLGSTYMSSQRQGANDSFSIFSLKRLLILFVVVYYIIRKKDLFVGSFGVTYLLISILASFMQGLWRFRLYVDPFYYIILATIIVELPQKIFKQKLLVYTIVFMLLFYFTIREWRAPIENSKWRAIDQYYPYHSIFDPEINHEQKNFFESI